MADEQASLSFSGDNTPSSPTMIPEHPVRLGVPIDYTRIKNILALPTVEEQIDAFGVFRNWFRQENDSPSYALLQKYMSGTISLSETVDKIAAPIEELWRSGDNCGAEPTDEPEEGYPWTSAVGSLMDLWYGVMHMAKRTPWTDNAAHQKLVDLILAFRARPPPTRSAEQAALIEKVNPGYWDDDEGKLWSELPWYGLCAAEVKNDCPNCGSGCQYAEGIAHTNLNSYQARLSLVDEPTARWNQELLALSMALGREEDPEVLDALVPAAAVWILILRERLYEKKLVEIKPAGTWRPKWPGELWTEPERGMIHIFSKAKWSFWKCRFMHLAGDERLEEETTQIAGCAAEVMDAIERGEG
ncbi:hypothetical protein K505DRAFT_321119 [Melanomma pulvis-pyrius CBS 109.77]|uniref:Uncharacterized protein n=1 Tax=Melanomma pulvis-pyrius CBS 109.77 TaxID=1314802 RepID=A0A6A6XVD2_9PLEO|nr:hypothetical protein K505DRAFT_321119 [Melanomma pulvis-pyrius CBS 109.77]